MKCIKIDLPRKFKEIRITTLADLHIGDRNADLKLIQCLIDEIKETPNLYCILNGDLMNNSTKTSVGNVYADTMTPSEQLYYLRDLLLPIKDKILCITTGNHERRTAKDNDIHLSKTLATFLGLEDRWCDEGAMLFVRIGELSKKATGKGYKRQVCYTIYVTHGSGSAKMANPALVLGNYIDADIYIHSHTHTPQVRYGSVIRTDTKNSTINQYDRMFVVTGATLKYGGYAQIKKYAPLPTNRNPIIRLSGTRKYFDQAM